MVVEGGSKVVDDKTINPGADKADDNHTEIVDEESGAADDGAGNGYGGSNVEMEEFVDNFSQDIKATRRGIDGEHQSLGSTE